MNALYEIGEFLGASILLGLIIILGWPLVLYWFVTDRRKKADK